MRDGVAAQLWRAVLLSLAAMDSAWYSRTTRMADGDTAEEQSAYESNAVAYHEAARVHAAASGAGRVGLPQVRVSWQGLLASTNICVDTFTSSCLASYRATGMHVAAELLFFLTHLHADHTTGLTPSWNLGTIYTSPTSKALLHEKFGIDSALVVALPLHRPQRLALNRLGSERMWVTLIDASTHCPGAAMILFEGYFGRILYTGDIRFDRKCEENFQWFAARYEALKARAEQRGARIAPTDSKLKDIREDTSANSKGPSDVSWLMAQKSSDKRRASDSSDDDDVDLTGPNELIDGAGILGTIDALYLDNTFCHPKYAHFHTTSSVLPAIASVIEAHPACDILLGGDTLGKEDLLVLLSHMLESKIVVPESRWRMLQAMAKHGVQLNTEVSEARIRQLTTRVASTDANGEEKAVVSESSYTSPFSDPRSWLSCFSPRPHDGFIKLGPKKQVTASNIEWMNGMVRTQREQSHVRSRRKRRKTASLEPSVELIESNRAAAAAIPIQPASQPDDLKDAASADSDCSADEDDDDDSSSASSQADENRLVDSEATLDRPVVGIIVSGWAVDRQGYGANSTAASTVAATLADDGASLLPTNAASSCIGPGPGNCKIHCLPYSSHSSYSELRRFVSLVRPNIIRPLVKGDCNTTVLDDLLNSHAKIKAIEIPASMTRPALKPIHNTTAAHKQHVERQVQALSRAVQESSTNFSSLANSIHSATTKAAGKKLASSSARVAMPIGTQECESPSTSRVNTRAAHSNLVVLDDDQPVDLTSSLTQSSMPPLEDEFSAKQEPTNRDDCTIVSVKKTAPSLERVRTWIDLFSIFEHFPSVPIEGFVPPPISHEHAQSYEYMQTNNRGDDEKANQSARVLQPTIRRLPRFLHPTHEIEADEEESNAAIIAASNAIEAVHEQRLKLAASARQVATAVGTPTAKCEVTPKSEPTVEPPKVELLRPNTSVRPPQPKSRPLATPADAVSLHPDAPAKAAPAKPHHAPPTTAPPTRLVLKKRKKRLVLPSYMTMGPIVIDQSTVAAPAAQHVQDLTVSPAKLAPSAKTPRARPLDRQPIVIASQ